MASETYFNDGQIVMFSALWCRGEPNEKALLALRGRVAEFDDSARGDCHYRIDWDATEAELETLGLDPEDFLQTDAIVHARKVR